MKYVKRHISLPEDIEKILISKGSYSGEIVDALRFYWKYREKAGELINRVDDIFNLLDNSSRSSTRKIDEAYMYNGMDLHQYFYRPRNGEIYVKTMDGMEPYDLTDEIMVERLKELGQIWNY